MPLLPSKLHGGTVRKFFDPSCFIDTLLIMPFTQLTNFPRTYFDILTVLFTDTPSAHQAIYFALKTGEILYSLKT